MKNLLIRWLTRIRPKNACYKQRFLIVSTTGLGDTLWATPAIRALKKNFPEAYIAVLTTPLGKAVLNNNDNINDFFILKKPHVFYFLIIFLKLKKKQIGQIFVFHASQRIVFLLCGLLNPTTLIGTYGQNKGLDSLFTKIVHSNSCHEIERRLRLVLEVGALCLDPLLEFKTTQEDEKNLAHLLEEVPSYIPLIGFHPGSKDGFKRWPKHHFIELGKRLIAETGCKILITGDVGEASLMQEIAKDLPGSISFPGMSLGVLGALIKKLVVLITNDTGPMHLAFALNTPTVALFSPTDPKLCGPYKAKNVRVIAKKPTCTPCLRKKCQDPFCLLQISPQEVYDATLSLLYPVKELG